MERLTIIALLCLAACGPAAPGTPAPVAQNVSLLVRDEFLSTQPCDDLSGLDISAELQVTGVLGACGVRVKEDGTALSICDRIPGRRERDVDLVYFTERASTTIEILSVTTRIDLTEETRRMVELDFTPVSERRMNDDDGDGATNLEELCAGTDPRNPNA